MPNDGAAVNDRAGRANKREETVFAWKPDPRLFPKVLLAGAVLIPFALFAVAAWFDYRATTDRAQEYVVTSVNALSEQTEEALRTARLILGRTLDRLDGMDWNTIDNSRDVHDFLAKLRRELPLVQSVFLVDPDGYNSVSSRAFPMPRFDDRDREYYIQARTGQDRLFVTNVFNGQMTGAPGFTVSRPRLVNGRFDGVVAVTLSPEYFRDFYEKIALGSDAATAALLRADGGVLVRYPPIEPLPKLAPDAPLLRAARSDRAGVLPGASPLDGVYRMAAVRELADQPLIASFALSRAYYLRQWYVHVAWMALFATLTATALLWTSLRVLREAAREEAQLRLLLRESERRKEAEAALQHLRRMEALGRLTGGLAHDFNNLLAAILGSLELAMKRLHDPTRVARLLTTATQAAERGARLTAQMLAFSRNKDISPRRLDVNAVIRESDGLLQRTVESLVQVNYALQDDLWPAIADRVQFEVALLNLASNARDAMPLGGTLAIMTNNATVRGDAAGAPPAGEYVRISVTDTGEGMNSETQARAFEPFFTTKSVGTGTGLGLSQVYGFAEHLGGKVTLSSAPGQGTTVTIWLPRALSAEPEAPETTPETLASPPLRILLVDDDMAVRTLTAEMLGDMGHNVATAASGPEAVARLRADVAFDLLLVDFAMPVMNGAQVAEAARECWPDLAILFMTGFADASVLNTWVERGYRRLNKPFTGPELAGAIARATEGRRKRPDNVVALGRPRG